VCHYAVLCCAVQAAAMAADASVVPVASDDVDGVQWIQVAKLRQLKSKYWQHCIAAQHF
jgi:hypothetical protein